jgi:hypothetical protein
MLMSVEFATDHRSVAAWPRSMEVGSTVKLTTRAAAGGAFGVGFASTGLGGGGGAGATGLGLHPAAPINNAMVNTAALSVLVFVRIILVPFLACPLV